MSAIDRIRQATRRELNGSGPSSADFSDPYRKHKIRLEQELERDLGHYSFANSTADSNGSPRRAMQDDYTHDYSMDYKGGNIDTGNSEDFFPRSPAHSTNELDKHFRDFSMNGTDSSLESVEMPRGAGKEMGTPELDLKDFDRPVYSKNRPIVDDNDLSSELHSPSSHARSASLSDFGGVHKRFSPIEGPKSGLRGDFDKELKTVSTPREKQHQLPERPRSAFLDRYTKPSPPFRRPVNPVGKTIDREYASKKPEASTLPRAFKDTTQLFEDLGIPTNNIRKEERQFTPTRNQSFRLPDITDIHSLVDDTTPAHGKYKSPRHVPLVSIPLPQEEKDIVSGLRQLQETVKQLTSEKHRQQATIRQLETELREQRRQYEHHQLRRSSRDSGFGSVEDSDEALERMKAMNAKDRMKLENQLSTLKSKIGLLETQLENERRRTRNVEEERNEAVKRLANALNESEGLKSENKVLKAQIASLRKQFEDSLKSSHVPKANVKDRVRERVEVERLKESAPKKGTVRGSGREVDRGFIDPVEIEELRKEIKALRESKEKSTKTNKADLKAAPKMIDQTTTDSEGNVQTIRIQLENAKDRKTKSSKPVKHRRIRQVVVESDDSSNDESDVDAGNSVTSDEEYEEFIKKAKKNIPIQPWLRPPGQAKTPTVNPEIENIINGLAKHNTASCSVCARKRRFKTANGGYTRRPLRDIHLNDDLTEPLYEGESIRPSVPPKQALSSVLSQLKDEFHHLQLQYRDLTAEYEGFDPGRGKRKRKAIAEKLRGVLEEFEAKADQIYALYDVVEGARQDGLGNQSRREWLEL